MSFRCPWCGSPLRSGDTAGVRLVRGLPDLSSSQRQKGCGRLETQGRAEQINQALPRWNRGRFRFWRG